MQQRKRLVIVLAALALVAALAAGPVAVLAQEGGQAGQAGSLRQLFLEKLAGALGVSQSQLEQAVDKAGQDALKEGVQNGYLTQQQADRLQQKAQGMPWMMLGMGKEGFGQKGVVRLNPAGSVAEALGLTPQEMKQQLAQGKTLEQLLTEKGLSKDQLLSQMLEEARQQLNQAVQQGKMTQQQADKMIEKMQQIDPAQMFNLKGGRKRGMHGWGGKEPAAQPQGA